jgi:hypothetical protein
VFSRNRGKLRADSTRALSWVQFVLPPVELSGTLPAILEQGALKCLIVPNVEMWWTRVLRFAITVALHKERL